MKVYIGYPDLLVFRGHQLHLSTEPKVGSQTEANDRQSNLLAIVLQGRILTVFKTPPHGTVATW